MAHKQFQTITVVDVEATRWQGAPPEGQKNDIIEIGYCFVDVPSLTISASESILVRPERSTVSPFCTQLTTLTQEQVEQKGWSFASACAWLRDGYHSDKHPWASFGEHDYTLVLNQCVDDKKALYPFHFSYHINVRLLAGMSFALSQQPSLKRTLELLGLTFEETHHRAGDDAWNTARCLAVLLARMRDVSEVERDMSEHE